MADFKKLIKQNTYGKTIEPDKIFASLPQKQYQYLRTPQTEVLKDWFSQRNEKTTVIKMNTGSGKTLVGLLILESCLRERKGPCVYVVPDNYLAEQAKKEADTLGIKTTTDIQSIKFQTSKEILICNIYQLFNGQSKFGVNKQEIEIGSIIIDDAHACIDVLNKQFSITIDYKEENKKLYNAVFKLFIDDIKEQSKSLATKLERSEPNTLALVPFWSWQDKCHNVFKFILDIGNNELKSFNLKLLENNFELCRCVIGSSCIEITPHIIPIQNFISFENAKCKIFMTATLIDDGILSTHFNIDEKYLNKPIKPKIVSDIGERLIFAPHIIDPEIQADDIKNTLIDLAKHSYNISIITPSFQKSKIWEDIASYMVDRSNILECVNELKKQDSKGKIAVFANRYDGIDLPDNACRVLVIDGLPNAQTLIDQINESCLQGNNNKIINQKIQKIEQGMGRGIRSNSDHCAVLLLDYDLALITAKYKNKFSEATKQQFELSEEIMEDCKNINDIKATIVQVLERDKDWIQAHKDRIFNIEYKTNEIDNFSILLRKVYNYAIQKDYRKAQEILEHYINKIPPNNEIFIGYAKQILAEYTNFTDSTKAQQILKSACSLNNQILKPISGIEYEKLLVQNKQADNIIQVLNSFNNHNDFLIELNSVLSHIIFIENSYEKFENSIQRIGEFLGFYSHRPDKSYKVGSDNLWGVDDKFFVIECKNGVTTDVISKKDVEQITSSISWFNQTYHTNDPNRVIPILIHKSNKFARDAFSSEDIRVLTPENMEKFKDHIKIFFKSIDKKTGAKDIFIKLKEYKLEPTLIIENFTEKYIKYKEQL